MGRVMAIDYGRKRCGVAVTDVLRIAANPLPTQRSCDLLDFICNYHKSSPLDTIVVGLPTTMQGEPSESTKYIEPFVKALKKRLPDIDIQRFDERFTSSIAHRDMIAAGFKKSKRREKPLADAMAATIILTDWLNSRQNIYT